MRWDGVMKGRRDGRTKGSGSFLGIIPPMHQLPTATPRHTHRISVSATKKHKAVLLSTDAWLYIFHVGNNAHLK